MASLNNVCMWSDDGWRKITIDKATKLYPLGTVSYHSGLFMCELCQQYVTLTDGSIKERHFRHSSDEESKNCPEHTFNSSNSISFYNKKHYLPIRIIVTSNSFYFKIGFINIPIDLIKNNFNLKIVSDKNTDISDTFITDQSNYNTIKYFEDKKISKKYSIYLKDFKLTEIDGINKNGTLFDVESGYKLVYDSDVEIGKEYYLLTSWVIFEKSYIGTGINIEKIRTNEDCYLYKVSSSKFNEKSAKFFLDFNCRLTKTPVSSQLIWPLFVKSDYILKHNENNMYMLVKGDVKTVKNFPAPNTELLNPNANTPKLYRIPCEQTRQQLISIGRIYPLKYTYFWKEPLSNIRENTSIVQVNDIFNFPINCGETSTLPPKKILKFESDFDGEIIIYKNSYLLNKLKIAANKCTEVTELSYGLNIKVMIGLDIVWEINFKE